MDRKDLKRNAHMERMVAEIMERGEGKCPKPHTPCLTEAQEWDSEHPKWKRSRRKVVKYE